MEFHNAASRASPAPGNAWTALDIALFGGAFALFTLWDYYAAGIRPFDFLGLTLVLAAVAIRPGTSHWQLPSSTLVGCCGVLVLTIVYSFVGMADHPDNAKPSVGMMLGATVMIAVQLLGTRAALVEPYIRTIAWIHLCAFVLQLIYFWTTGRTLNYHALFGLEPRVLSSVFRPAGLFLEPAIYCFLSASVLLLRRRWELPQTLLDHLLLVSMFISISLWGMLIGSLYLLVYRRRLFLILGAVIASAAVIALPLVSQSPAYKFVVSRLLDLGNDASAQDRFGGTFGWMAELFVNPVVMFGQGVNNFFEERGSNGLSYILNSMGMFGLALFVLCCLVGSDRNVRRWIEFGMAFGLLLTAAPLWKGLYFWCWLGLMLLPWTARPLKQDDGLLAAPAPVADVSGFRH